MLKPPKLGGADQLRLFVDEIGAKRACKVLRVHPTTLRRWLREAVPVPQAALQALYWLTSEGYGDACSEASWTHQFLLFKVERLEHEIATLYAPGRSVAAANLPMYRPAAVLSLSAFSSP